MIVSRFVRKLGLLLALTPLFLHPLAITQIASPVSPVLLVVNDNQDYKWGRYLGEIFREEGLNSYDVTIISALTSRLLSQYPLVVLAQTSLTSNQATLLTHYEQGGGQLIAMRPDSQIAGLFGLGAAAGTQTDGYLALSVSASIDGQPLAAGLVTDPLQIHGGVDEYEVKGDAVTLGQLFSSATTATTFPAIVSGTSGTGRGIAFLYDLATNVILMRQGNPANSTYVNPTTGVTGDVDGDGIFRTIDLFQGIGGGAEWVDKNKIPIPQADEQTRYFARLVKLLVGEAQPQPSLWYFPGNAMTMLVMTGDAHANPESYYQTEVNSIAAHHGNITLYLSIGSTPTPTDAIAWINSYNFTFGIHPYWDHPDTYPPYNVTNLKQGYQAVSTWFKTYYNVAPYNIKVSKTVRNHQVSWAGWTDSADYAASYGIGMDTSFYNWGRWLQNVNNSWPHGYITGSGQPMKFIRVDGTIISVYQQLTELVDEQMINNAGGAYEGLSGPQGVAVSQQMIDSSLNGYYEALMTQNHVDYYSNEDPRVWAEGTMDYAYSKGVPIWNADQWLAFTTIRHNANYTNINWSSTTGTLTFTLNATQVSGVNLTTLLPASYKGLLFTSIRVDGQTVTSNMVAINTVNQIFVSVPAGSHTFSVSYIKAIPPLSSPIPTSTNTPLPPATTTLISNSATNLPAATLTNSSLAATPTPTAKPLSPISPPTLLGRLEAWCKQFISIFTRLVH